MERTCKIVIVGAQGVGKTSFVHRLIHGSFSGHYKNTIGVDYKLRIYNMDGVSIRAQLWDIAGQERFAAITRVFYRDADACVIMCDISRPDTFEVATKWKNDVTEKCSLYDGRQLPCFLLINKCDLKPQPLSTENLTAFCEVNDFLTLFEISAKNGLNVEQSIKYILKEWINGYTGWKVHEMESSPNFISEMTDELKQCDSFQMQETRRDRSYCC